MQKKHKIIHVKPNERISCPTKHHENWNLHPRVFINLEDKKTNSCPYCGVIFEVEKEE